MRVRVWLVLLSCLFLAVSWILLALYGEREHLRNMAVVQLREYLEARAGVEFHMKDARVSIVPLKIVLDGVTVLRGDEPWLLTVEKTEISVSLYAVLFRQGGFSRLRLVKPRFFLHDGDEDPAAGERSSSAPGEGEVRLPSLLTMGLPFRGLDVVEGEVEASQAGTELSLGSIEFSTYLSGGRLMGTVGYGRGLLQRGGKEVDLGQASGKLVLDDRGLRLRTVEFDSPLVEGRISGSVDYAGRLDLEGSMRGSIERISAYLGGSRELQGSVSFQGSAGGTLRDPRIRGSLSLNRPRFREDLLPGLKGTVRWDGGKRAWSDLAASVGEGKIQSEGFVDFSLPGPRYGLLLEAGGIDPGQLGAVVPEGVPLRHIDGELRWEGEGFGREKRWGAGSLKTSFSLERWRPGRILVDAQAELKGSHLQFSKIAASSGEVALEAAGALRPDGSFDGTVIGSTGDLSTLTGHWGIEGVGGNVAFEGKVDGSPAKVRFAGPLLWAKGEAYGLQGLEVAGDVVYEDGIVALSGARAQWRGSKLEADGTFSLSDRKVDILTKWNDLHAAEVAALFGFEKEGPSGLVSLEGRLLGDWGSPILAGRFEASELRYGRGRIEGAGGSLSLSHGRLRMSEVTLWSGTSSLTFEGDLIDGRYLSGTLEGPRFDLRNFVPGTEADILGELRGRLSGTVEQPVVTGSFQVYDLSYHLWHLDRGAGEFEYREGVLSVEGSLDGEGNSYLLKVGTGGSWPFEATVALERFSPEMAREGMIFLPPQVNEMLRGFSFLAVGDFHASGDLVDVASVRAELELKTTWVYTEKQTLQNRTPLRVVWSDEGVEIENFTLVGEDYLVSIGGEGGPLQGWDLVLEGQVDLALFERYWDEIEWVDAPGRIRFRVAGQWDSPELSGIVRFKEGSLKLSSFDEPINEISGTAELAGRTVILTDFSGTMGEGAFAAGGLYYLDTNEVDTFIEGRLDLSLFEGRVPGTREMSGPVEVRLSLKGSAARPEIFGEAKLVQGEVLHLAVPQTLRNLTGTVILEERKMEVRNLAGLMGGGEVLIDGFADWSEGAVEVDFTFTGRRITYILEGTAKGILDADLSLSGGVDDMKLEGQIEIIRARYFREFTSVPELPKGLTGLKRDTGEEGEKKDGSVLQNLALDISIEAPNRFWVSNSMAELETTADVHLGGTLGKPHVEGEVRLLHGDATYYSRNFIVHSGFLHNTPPAFDPVLEAQAEVVVGDTRIYLLLEGPLRKLTLQLTSLPPRSQEDLIALLTVGHTRTSLKEREGEALAVGAAVLFTTPVFEQIGGGAREVTGIELFQVEPSIEEEGGSARLTVGTRLSERLFMSASQSIGVTEDQQVSLEYEILDYISVLGQQLRQGIYSLDFVFQLSFD